MDNNRLQKLLSRYFDNTITPTDCEALLAYLDEGDPVIISSAIDEVVKDERSAVPFTIDQQTRVYHRLIANIRRRQSDINPPSQPRTNTAVWLRVAAVLAIVFSVGALLYFKPLVTEPVAPKVTQQVYDILLPDENQALLTLSDGRTIVLSDSLDGVLAEESGVIIRRGEDGSVIYDGSRADAAAGGGRYHTFTTPKGHTYQLLLPDGTNVWLNTASSIRYPVVFGAGERRVTLTGEAYFEVARDGSKPFKIEAKNSQIEVLGTHFNVSAFDDEALVTTTLLEGAVDISKKGRHIILKPGEQAVVEELSDKIHHYLDVDVRGVMAWRNGYFRFDNEPIENIIKKVSRWYDIEEVEYQGTFDERFTGTFQRSKGVSLLFSHLEKLAPIRFEITERRVVVMK